jgi:hypothetical protein
MLGGAARAILRPRRSGRNPIRSVRLPRPIAYLMGLAAVTYLVQGWTAGSEGFSPAHTFAIVLAEVLNLVWMVWLALVAWRVENSEPVSRVVRVR